MLTSLLLHHPNQSFRIFLLVPPSFSEANRRKLIESLNFWAPEVEFVPVNEPEGLKVDGHISSATYFRLCVDLLPHNIETALYLDSDVIINDSVLDLLQTDISNYVLAAVPDVWADRNEIVAAKICLKEKARYFNAGVLLLNLKRWKSEKISIRALKFCISNPESVTYWDQCGLNHVIQGNFYVLDKKWNFQVGHMRSTGNYKFHPSAEKEASSAAIIHFTTHLKPWSFMCMHPMKDLYFKYLKYTAWHDFSVKDCTLDNVVKRYFAVHFPSASLRVYSFAKRLRG